jgi:hypothetical protein
MGLASPFWTFTFQELSNGIRNFVIQWVLTPWNTSLKIRDSIRIPTPKVGIHSRMCGSFLHTPENANMTPGLHVWPTPFHRHKFGWMCSHHRNSLHLINHRSMKLWYSLFNEFVCHYFLTLWYLVMHYYFIYPNLWSLCEFRWLYVWIWKWLIITSYTINGQFVSEWFFGPYKLQLMVNL